MLLETARHSRPGKRFDRKVALGLIGLAMAGCDPTAAISPLPPDVRPWVAGVAVASLDADGHFVFPKAALAVDTPAIDEKQASDLATAYIRLIAASPALIDQLQSQRRGTAVDLSHLVPAARVELALSPYETTPPEYGAATLRSRGPYFLVRMRDGVDPIMTVAVSVHATELTINDGNLVFPTNAGNEFWFDGNPPGVGVVKPISPENAVEIAAEATGAKVVSLPEFYRGDWTFDVFLGKWFVALDRPVQFRRLESGAIISTSSVYVGMPDSAIATGPTLLLPRVVQPQVEQVTANQQLVLRAGRAVWFEQVSVVK